MVQWLAGIFLVLFAMPAFAFELGMPVDCDMKKDCVVQNFVDHDVATGEKAYRDFTCMQHSYDGHKGTDIRTRDRTIMQRSVSVLAVADGVVLGGRDGVQDFAPTKANMECGNGVRISHAEGWVTQYCHMRQGSVRAKKGDKVAKGQVIGLIGQSGQAAFPHVHLQVEHNGTVVDPYTGTAMADACGAETQKALWDAEAARHMAFAPTGLLGAGFTDSIPKDGEFQQGLHRNLSLSVENPIVLFWAEMYGVEKGDVAYIALQDPQGIVVAEQRKVLDRNRAIQSYTAGLRKRDGAWKAGTYRGVLTLERGGKKVVDEVFTVELRP